LKFNPKPYYLFIIAIGTVPSPFDCYMVNRGQGSENTAPANERAPEECSGSS